MAEVNRDVLHNKLTAPLTITPLHEIYSYVLAHTNEPEILRKCREETLADNNLPSFIQVNPDEGRFMSLLTRLANVKKAVEVGVFTGYSSLCVALQLPDDGKLFALDIDKSYTDIAMKYWKEAGVSNKIDLRLGPAQESLNKLLEEGHADTIDMFFIDADKHNYDLYYEMGLKLVRVGGIIMVDNVLWAGCVIDPNDQSEDTVAIRKLNDKIIADERVMMGMLAFGDGVTLAIRVK